MAAKRKSKMRWRKEDEKLLAKRVRAYNAKLTRLRIRHPELAEYLPGRKKVKEIKQKIYTRADFNRHIKSLDRFMKKGAETPVITKQGVKTTKYALKEIAINTRRINRQRAKRREALKESDYLGTVGAHKRMGLGDKKVNVNSIPISAWDEFVNQVEFTSMDYYYAYRDQLYINNYKTAIIDNLGTFSKEIIKLIDKIPNERMVELYYEEPDLQIDFIYSPQEVEIVANQIKSLLLKEIETREYKPFQE